MLLLVHLRSRWILCGIGGRDTGRAEREATPGGGRRGVTPVRRRRGAPTAAARQHLPAEAAALRASSPRRGRVFCRGQVAVMPGEPPGSGAAVWGQGTLPAPGAAAAGSSGALCTPG